MTTSQITQTTVSIPGTCGELVQGWHPDWEQPVLVSCPIAKFSSVEIRPRPDSQLCVSGNQPVGYDKVRRAVKLAFAKLDISDWGADITITSQLLPGRGMASSTADVVGAIVGVALAHGKSLLPETVARLACQVEPSDSTMFPALTALAYRDSGHSEPIGPVPALPLLLLDPGQQVDTLAFNDSLDMSALRELDRTTQVALQYLKEGAIKADPHAIGAAATLSAEQYQSISFNLLLEKAKKWAKETGAVGIVRAHSGSVIGLLYPFDTDLTDPANWLANQFEVTITQTHLAPGGTQVMNETKLPIPKGHDVINYHYPKGTTLPITNLQSPHLRISASPEVSL